MNKPRHPHTYKDVPTVKELYRHGDILETGCHDPFREKFERCGPVILARYEEINYGEGRSAQD